MRTIVRAAGKQFPPGRRHTGRQAEGGILLAGVEQQRDRFEHRAVVLLVGPRGEQQRQLEENRRLQAEVERLKKEDKKAVRRYRREQALKPYQAELIRMQQFLEKTKRRMIILFEGRDASGKGGTIRRVTRYMNEKHYRVVALGKPTDAQRTQWFFQRYVTQFPRGGEVVLFDRSWYNRAGVERVMGFCSDEEYREFYKHIAHDFDDPLEWVHNRVEGTNEYTSLLYVPKRAPFDLYNRETPRVLKLYVKRVFIMDDAEQLMPYYLRFVRVLVDSDDLPLNVSREILQHNKLIDTIRGGSVKKVLGVLESMTKDEPETYKAFWKEFGNVLKEGPGEDFANRERIAGLLRFASTHGGAAGQNVSLQDYIARMKPE